MLVFARSPKKSLREFSRETDIEKSSVHRILRAQIWRSYILILVHALNEEYPYRRLKFCEWFLHKCDEREDFKDSIAWSDGATFKLNGTIIRHNCVYWANENPNIIGDKTVDLAEVVVWCGGLSED